MGKSQEFKATVNFGAKIDPSFGAAVSAIDEKLTGAAKDAAHEVNKLTRQQQKLKKRIEEANAAGKDVNKLTTRYDELSSSIDKTAKKLSRLNAVGKTLTGLGNVGRFGMAGGRLGMAVARPAMGAGMIAGGVLTGAITGAIAVNAETALQLGKAQGYGLDFGTHMAYQGISKAIGLDEDAMGDLLDEMKNKIGEVGNEKMLNPLLRQIGMTKTMANRMMKQDPNKLFKEVMSRLNEDVKAGKMSAAQAGSFADQLFGGEAQKIVSYMTTLGMTLEDLEGNARKYNLVTEEGAKQAVKGQYALSSLWGVVTSGFQEIVGRTLGAASNDILAGADVLKTKLEAATPEIIKAVTDWMAPDEGGETGPQRLWGTVSDIGDALGEFAEVVMAIAKKLKWVVPEARKPEEMPTLDEALNRAEDLAAEEAEYKYGKLTPLEAVLNTGNAPLVRELTRQRKEEAENLWRARHAPVPLGALGVSTPETILPFTQRADGPVNSNNQIHVTVMASPGQSPEDVGKSTVDTINKTLGMPNFKVAGSPTFDEF